MLKILKFFGVFYVAMNLSSVAPIAGWLVNDELEGDV